MHITLVLIIIESSILYQLKSFKWDFHFMQGFPKNFMVISIQWLNIGLTFQKIAEYTETIQNRAFFLIRINF